MSPMDLLLVTLGPHTQYKAYKDSFYHGNTHAISRFLNVVEAEKRGHEKLTVWVRLHALTIVLEEIAREMDALRVLRMSIKDITPEFFTEFNLQTAITDVLEQLLTFWCQRSQTGYAYESISYVVMMRHAQAHRHPISATCALFSSSFSRCCSCPVI